MMRKTRIWLALLFLLPLAVRAQFTDNFSDGNFTAGPAWTGSTTLFQVNASQQLQSAGMAITDTLYLSTPSTAVNTTEWQFWVNLAFQPSTTNQLRVFLMSDQSNLLGDLNGYYVEVGATGTVDSLLFFRQTGPTRTKLFTGALGCFGGTAANTVRIRVRRDGAGNWQLFSDCTGGSTWNLEGSVTDNTHTTTAHFGFYCKHTSTRADKFFFDDVYVGPWVNDLTPPDFLSVAVVSSTQLDLDFSEPLSLATAQNTSLYNLDQGAGAPQTAVRDAVDSSLVHLTWASPFVNATQYQITASALADTAGNVMPAPQSQSFFYFVGTTPWYKAVILNEVLPDPDPVVALPLAEFVELHNRSNAWFDLAGWQFRDPSTTVTLPTYYLAPGAYVTLCKYADTTAYNVFGPVLGLSSLPSLNNAGDGLGLRAPGVGLIDTLNYDIAWFNDPIKDDGGWTLELVRPSDTCSYTGNWRASVDPDGGTPGQANSVLDPTADLTPPVIASVNVISPDTLQVCFDETMDATELAVQFNYVLSGGIGSAVSATPILPGYSCVTLAFSSPLNPGTTYTLTISNMMDCKGNGAGNLTAPVDLGGGSFKEIIFNEILPDPDPVVGLPQAEFVELYNRGSRSINLNGWKLRDASSTATLPAHILAPGAYVIVCALADTQDYSPLGPVIGVSTLPSLNNSGDNLGLRSNLDELVDTLAYSITWFQDAIKDDGGWTLELVRPSDTCSYTGNWRASVDVSGGTPGRANSVLDLTDDLTPPSLLSITLISADTLQVCFDETMDAAALGTAGNYSVSPSLGTPVAALPQGPDYACVLLALSAPAYTGVVYTLSISNLADCKGNVAGTLSGTFDLGGARYKEVILTEIFADPAPVIGLPEAEYVEVYNRGSRSLNLGGWSFRDGSTRVTLPAYALNPGAYVVLCQEGDTALFSPLGPVLGLPTLPSLNNSGDNLGLRDRLNQLIDSVRYTLDWYSDAVKDDGGWSLELIHLDDTCGYTGNWTASQDPDGGTPGQQNSVFSSQPDIFGPQLLGVALVAGDTVEICFNETMDAGTLTTLTNYDIPGMGNPVAAFPVAPENACVRIVLPQMPDTGTVYVVNISNMADCKGNPGGLLSGDFVLGGNAQPFEVVFNELFPDPSPVIGLPEAEFVELTNAGSQAISLNGWQLRDRSGTQANVPNYTLLPGDYVLLCATSSAADLLTYGDVLAVPGFPGLNNAGDSLELFDAQGVLIDFVYYSEDWYGDVVKADGGWTLERVDAGFPCFNSGNWRASTAAAGGTPGAVNSIAGTFTDAQAPSLVSVRVLDPQMLRLSFDEAMDPALLTDVTHYTVDKGIGQPVVAALIVQGGLTVDLLFTAALDSNEIYCITVTGLQDCPGNVAGAMTYCFGIPVRPAAGDLILNEILFNPYTGGADFVELVNTSGKILDLSQIFIAEVYPGTDSVYNSDPISTVPMPFMPGEYLCVTTDKNFQLLTYLPPFANTILEVSSLATFDDDEGECAVLNAQGEFLDRYHYLDDYHFPNLDDKEGVSLERLSFTAPTQNTDNWHSAASTVRYATPGYQNSQISGNTGSGEVSISPETFSPDQDGTDDYTTIQYHFPDAGANARVVIYDSKGRPVRILKENTLLGTEPGFFTWDGTDEAGHKVLVGVYVVLFEVSYPNSGKQEVYKLSTVVAARF